MQKNQEKKEARARAFAKVFSIVFSLLAIVSMAFTIYNNAKPEEAHAMNNAQTPPVQVVELDNNQLAEYGVMGCMWTIQEEYVMEEWESVDTINNGAWDLSNYSYSEVGEYSYLTINTNTQISIHTDNDEGKNKSLIQLFYYNTVGDARNDSAVGQSTRELTLFVNNNSRVDLAQFIPNNALIYKIAAYYQIDEQTSLDWWSLSNYNFYYTLLENLQGSGDNGRYDAFVEYTNINYNTELGIAYATISNYQEVNDEDFDEEEPNVYTYVQIPIVFSGANRVEFFTYSNSYYTQYENIALQINNFSLDNKLVDYIGYTNSLSSAIAPKLVFTDGSTFPSIAHGEFTINNPNTIIVSSSNVPINDASLEGALIDSPIPNIPYTPYQITKANTVWYNITIRNNSRDLSSPGRELLDDIADFFKDNWLGFVGAGLGSLLGYLALGKFGAALGAVLGFFGLGGLGDALGLGNSLLNNYPALPYIAAVLFIIFVVIAVIRLINNR